MSARIRARLKQIEKASKKPTIPTANGGQAAQRTHATAEWFRRKFAEIAPEAFAFIEKHVLPDQRVPLMRALINSEEDEDSALVQWFNQPFAPWATMPPDFVFPRALFETFFAPADTLKMGEACEQCGLCLPVYTFGLDDDVKAFNACPACGGMTSSATCWHAERKIEPR